MFAMAKL